MFTPISRGKVAVAAVVTVLGDVTPAAAFARSVVVPSPPAAMVVPVGTRDRPAAIRITFNTQLSCSAIALIPLIERMRRSDYRHCATVSIFGIPIVQMHSYPPERSAAESPRH